MTVNTALQKLPYASIFYNASGYGREHYQGEFEKTFLKGRCYRTGLSFFRPVAVIIICHAREPSTPSGASVVCSYGDAKNGQSKHAEEYEDDEKED